MSEYEELRQTVSGIASEAENSAFAVHNFANQIDGFRISFHHYTATTMDRSANTVEAAFSDAEKQLLLAAKALIEAAKAGYEWSGSGPELKLVLKPHVR